MSNPIPAENQNIGSTAWLPNSNLATTQIQGYADRHALDPGSVINFFVSTQSNGTAWSGALYRLGWYQGTGARLLATIPRQTGVAQGYFDGTTLNNCPTAISNSTTHLLEAGWSVSYSWTVPANAVTGIYLAQFTDTNGKFTYCTFVVRGNRPADYAYIRPTTTDAAYNPWGGWSLYSNPGVGVQVSCNRPDWNGGGTGGLLQLEIQAIKWLERQGYNLSYLSMQDAHENPAWLKQYGAVLSGGHNEYWTREVRDGIEAALVSGVGLGFLGANAAYWQMRFEADHAGNASRTITCYKVATSAGPALSLDPYYGVDNSRVTALWRDPVLNRPESALCGIMFVDLVVGNPPLKTSWSVAMQPSQTYLGGTGLQAGAAYGFDLVGDEFDKQQSGSPANLQIIGSSRVTRASGGDDTQHTSTYIAPSGALVFASGSHAFTFALDTYRWSFAGTPYTVPGIQQLMSNILPALLQGKAARNVQTGQSSFSMFHR
ncbi:MAG TPA: N,N-dimethylformamidase beta subunit family domain-containing protein [Ktedonobacteraceae bacterium]